MRKHHVAVYAILIVMLVGCSDETPTGASRSTGEMPVSAAVAGSVPDCGFENGLACAPIASGPRCDRALQLSNSGTPLNIADDVCLDDTRHLVGAAFRDSWLDWALANQRTLAIDEPINWVLHLTTHNAFNNVADGETLDPNQAWSISDQLDLGSRFIWLDLHWVNGQARLCHAHVVEVGPEFHIGCGPGDRLFGYALKEIKEWLDDNPNEIVFLDLEAYVEGHNEHVTDPIESILGNRVFRESDRIDARPEVGRWPSRRELLKDNKRVIIGALGASFGGWTHPKYLPNNFNIRLVKNLVVERSGGIVTNCGTAIEGWETLVANNDVFRVVGEDRTTLGIQNNWAGTLTRTDVEALANCNVPLISFDMLSGRRPTSNQPVSRRLDELSSMAQRLPDEDLQRYAVWSWREDDRGRSGDGALLVGSTGRWSSVATSESHRFACAKVRSETRPRGTGADEWPDRPGAAWRITSRAGMWKEGGRACLDEFGAEGFVYSVPVNGHMNGKLRMQDAVRGNVWLNYNDIEAEGRWLINRRPVADAGADQTVECVSHHGTQVRLNGSASTDAEEHTLSYEWRGAFGTAFGAQPIVMLPAGRHEVKLIIDDGFGGVSTDIVEINALDTKPPEIRSASVSPSSLWPANHKMTEVKVTVDVSDACDASPLCTIVVIRSSELQNAKGDGNTEVDWIITGPLKAELRAERSGGGAGRKYTITIKCADASGNFVSRDLVVTVPHDRGM